MADMKFPGILWLPIGIAGGLILQSIGKSKTERQVTLEAKRSDRLVTTVYPGDLIDFNWRTECGFPEADAYFIVDFTETGRGAIVETGPHSQTDSQRLLITEPLDGITRPSMRLWVEIRKEGIVILRSKELIILVQV